MLFAAKFCPALPELPDEKLGSFAVLEATGSAFKPCLNDRTAPSCRMIYVRKSKKNFKVYLEFTIHIGGFGSFVGFGRRRDSKPSHISLNMTFSEPVTPDDLGVSFQVLLKIFQKNHCFIQHVANQDWPRIIAARTKRQSAHIYNNL